MISISDFNIDQKIVSIFDTNKIDDPSRIVETLELYDFLSREEILNKISNKVISYFRMKYNTEVPIYVDNLVNVTRDKTYEVYENKYNIIVSVDIENKLDIIIPLMNEIDFSMLELELSNFNLRIVYVTPVNYYELLGVTLEYNPEIIFKRLILECLRRKATDLHLTVQHRNKTPYYVVKYRRDENLCELNLFRLTQQLNKDIAKIMIEKYTNKNSVDLESSAGVTAVIDNLFNDNSLEIRITVSKVIGGFECVCRIQKMNTVCMEINELGFNKNLENVLYRLTKKRTGLTLITGPMRTGKNTTAFAIANEMTKQPIKIKSLENPVESLMDFPQSDYMGNRDNLVELIRLIKKQDTNVVFLNEIPDPSVAFAVMDLVNSSVYVITTLHIDRLWHLPYKLFEFYGDSYKNIISQMNCIINQKMFGRLCNHCLDIKTVSDISELDKKDLLEKFKVTTYGVARGCECCHDKDSGIYGVIPGKNVVVAEYLMLSDNIKQKLLSCNHVYEMEKVLKEELIATGNTLEKEICNKIESNILGLDQLNYIL